MDDGAVLPEIRQSLQSRQALLLGVRFASLLVLVVLVAIFHLRVTPTYLMIGVANAVISLLLPVRGRDLSRAGASMRFAANFADFQKRHPLQSAATRVLQAVTAITGWPSDLLASLYTIAGFFRVELRFPLEHFLPQYTPFFVTRFTVSMAFAAFAIAAFPAGAPSVADTLVAGLILAGLIAEVGQEVVRGAAGDANWIVRSNITPPLATFLFVMGAVLVTGFEGQWFTHILFGEPPATASAKVFTFDQLRRLFSVPPAAGALLDLAEAAPRGSLGDALAYLRKVPWPDAYTLFAGAVTFAIALILTQWATRARQLARTPGELLDLVTLHIFLSHPATARRLAARIRPDNTWQAHQANAALALCDDHADRFRDEVRRMSNVSGYDPGTEWPIGLVSGFTNLFAVRGAVHGFVALLKDAREPACVLVYFTDMLTTNLPKRLHGEAMDVVSLLIAELGWADHAWLLLMRSNMARAPTIEDKLFIYRGGPQMMTALEKLWWVTTGWMLFEGLPKATTARSRHDALIVLEEEIFSLEPIAQAITDPWYGLQAFIRVRELEALLKDISGPAKAMLAQVGDGLKARFAPAEVGDNVENAMDALNSLRGVAWERMADTPGALRGATVVGVGVRPRGRVAYLVRSTAMDPEAPQPGR